MRLNKETRGTLLEQLVHNGIIVPNPPPYRGLVIHVRGQPIQLTPKQEEMALAWAKKQGTPYVSDPVFVDNFMRDFSLALGSNETLSVQEVDFAPAIRVVEAEREAKAQLTREERKVQAAVRKAIRQELKEKYGYAIVNGDRVELGNYMTEPSGIFMGRGEHPLRGRWKEGAAQADVTLNLSPDAPQPEGDWAERVWQPESLWVARWEDKLSGRLKYIWLSDTAPVKQEREAQKFDKAIELHAELDAVREYIQQGLRDRKPRRRMIAMACYLIDVLCLRVGDEKDADEADTVGATTLRPEHVTVHPDGVAEFQFLGKDSVPWHKSLELPPLVYSRLEELIRNARPSSSAGNGDEFHPTRDLPQLFPDIHSRNVNRYLSRALKGLSAKVFRTHHATEVVQQSLAESGVAAGDPEYKKWHAVVMANLEAAILCNHTKSYNGNWEATQQRYQERLEKAEARRKRYRAQLAASEEKLQVLLVEAASRRAIEQAKVAKIDPGKEAQLEKAQARLEKVKARYEKRIATAKARVQASKERVTRAEHAIGKIQAQCEISGHKRTWNLGTSLKSYIDPRVYYEWGQQVGYDVIEKYYPKALRRKFAWVREDEFGTDAEVQEEAG
jgi:DNA topoisomerase-1